MNSYRLKLLILTLITFLFIINNCDRIEGEKGHKNESPAISVSFQSFDEKFKSNRNLQILDVRTQEEYKSGHIPGALLLPVQDLESSILRSVAYGQD